METFFNTPVYRTELLDRQTNDFMVLLDFQRQKIELSDILSSLSENKLVLIRSNPFPKAGELFKRIVKHYELHQSYELQMQFAVHMMKDRKSVHNDAVTVNDRDAFQIIQPHSEGDTTSPLDLFALYCVKNSQTGGENILSYVDQSACYSRVKAKEKIVVGEHLTKKEISSLAEGHFNVSTVVDSCTDIVKILRENEKGLLGIRKAMLKPMKSVISGEDLFTLWDNITVHDHAFHEYQFELLKHLGILISNNSTEYNNYMHVESDSDWAPADTRSGSLQETSDLFAFHVVHKMQPNDLLILNNRAWTHSVNNWAKGESRELLAMYA